MRSQPEATFHCTSEDSSPVSGAISFFLQLELWLIPLVTCHPSRTDAAVVVVTFLGTRLFPLNNVQTLYGKDRKRLNAQRVFHVWSAWAAAARDDIRFVFLYSSLARELIASSPFVPHAAFIRR